MSVSESVSACACMSVGVSACACVTVYMREYVLLVGMYVSARTYFEIL